MNSESSVGRILSTRRYHRSKELKDFLKQNKKITFRLLPPYSPNLNPIERLWKLLNEYERNNVFFASKKDFCHAIERFFKQTIPKIPGVLKSRMTDRFEILPGFT